MNESQAGRLLKLVELFVMSWYYRHVYSGSTIRLKMSDLANELWPYA